MNEHLDDLITRYALGIASEADVQELMKWLETEADANGKRAFIQWVNVASVLAQTVDEKTPPASLKSTILASLDADPRTRSTERVLRFTPMQMLMSVAATLIIAVIGTFFYMNGELEQHIRSERLINSELAMMRNVVQERDKIIETALCNIARGTVLSGSDANGQRTTGKLYLNAVSREMALHICRLPKLDEKTVYVLWAKKPDGTFTRLTNIDASRTDVIEANYHLGTYAGEARNEFLISVEANGSASKQPGKTLIMKSS